MNDKKTKKAQAATRKSSISRRSFVKGVGAIGAVTAAAAVAAGTPAWDGQSMQDAFGSFFQDQYKRMTPEEIGEALARIERKARRRFGVDIKCENTPPIPGVVFGYAINISK